MSGNVESIDDQIMCMVGMGFELEDCQAAVENGKLSVNEAVDWIIQGKPVALAPTLKLTANAASQMDDVGESGSSVSTALSTTDEGSNLAANVDVSSTDVQSRVSMSDGQREIKRRFEEKQREEARRSAHAERVAKKKAHAETLKRIQEDREMQKKRLGGTGSPERMVTDGARVDDSGAADTVNRPQPSVAETSLLQIRLVDGRCVKEKFSAESPLAVVHEFIQLQSNINNFQLIQPFPRVEFGEEHAQMSLRDLCLVPNGSLVVKVLPSESAASSSVIAQVSDDDYSSSAGASVSVPSSQMMPDPSTALPLPPSSDDDNMAGNDINVADDYDVVANDMDTYDEDVDDDSDVVADDNNVPHPPPAAGPGFGRGAGPPPGIGGFVGGGGGIGGFPGPAGLPHALGGAGRGQHIWGAGGQRLIGEVLDNVILPHQNQDPRQLAMEAALKRYGTVPVHVSVAADITTTASCSVPSLRELLIKYVSGHICSTRNPITGLQGLPAHIASGIIDYLLQEHLLRPKTLQAFVSCRLQEITLDCYIYCTNDLLAALRHHTCLKSVSLYSCPLITFHGLQHLIALKSLRKLNLGSCQQMNDNCLPVLAAMPSLVTLVLENTAVTDVGVKHYASCAPPLLENLDLSRTNVTQDIFVPLRALQCLSKLNLEHSKVTGLSGVEGLAKLKVLNLANTAIVTDSLLCCRHCPSLVALNIANTVNINGDQALQYLLDLPLVDLQLPNRITTTDVGLQFISNMRLRSADLTNFIYVTDASMEYIGRITTLQRLHLTNTKVTDAGMLFLEGLQDLKELHADRTLITDQGAAIVKAFTRLQELNLSNTSITDEFLASGALNQCVELVKLNLSKTDISDKGLRKLHLPMLTMLYVDETFVRPENVLELPLCPSLRHLVYRSLRTPPTEENH